MLGTRIAIITRAMRIGTPPGLLASPASVVESFLPPR
jgi:hypothetical protein